MRWAVGINRKELPFREFVEVPRPLRARSWVSAPPTRPPSKIPIVNRVEMSSGMHLSFVICPHKSFTSPLAFVFVVITQRITIHLYEHKKLLHINFASSWKWWNIDITTIYLCCYFWCAVGRAVCVCVCLGHGCAARAVVMLLRHMNFISSCCLFEQQKIILYNKYSCVIHHSSHIEYLNNYRDITHATQLNYIILCVRRRGRGCLTYQINSIQI